jgi:hypothetical protein
MSLIEPFQAVIDLAGYDALTRSEQIGMDLFAGFNEISHSYDTLLDIEVYVARFPYANTRITRSGHLRFIIEAYLHESYTLGERLKTYPTLSKYPPAEPGALESEPLKAAAGR